MKLTYKIYKNIDHVFEYLTDMQKFVSVHPVISTIENISDNNYLVHETLKVGFIPFSFTYPVKIEKSFSNKKIEFKATVFKLTEIQMQFVLTEDGAFTIIGEEIQIKSPLPVKFLMNNIFKKQHNKLFENIEMKEA